MGKKRGWFFVVKKILSPKSKKDQETPKSKKKWLGKSKDSRPISSPEETEVAKPPPTEEDGKLAPEAQNERRKHAYSVALATVMVAAAAVAAAQAAAAEVVRLGSSVPRKPGKLTEEIAAIKIQAAFRGHLARNAALRALRRSARLKSSIQTQSVKRQATTALRCMQTLARVQSRIRARRLRMSEENQVILQQQQLQHQREKEIENLRASMGEEWKDSTQSKEQAEARKQNKQEAAMRRERALAYAFSRQQSWKNSSKSVNQTLMDPNNPHWGWSWLERWMAIRPWEIRSSTVNNDRVSVKNLGASSLSIDSLRPSKSSRPAPSHRQSASTPPSSKPPSISSVSTKIRQPTPWGSRRGGDDGHDSNSWSTLSVHQSDRYRRQISIASSSMKARSSSCRLASPLAGSAKKRLSLPASTAKNMKHSGLPTADVTLVKDVKVKKGEKLSNGKGWEWR